MVLHAFTDGRDTLPTSSPDYIAQVEAWLAEAGAAGVPARIGDRDAGATGRWTATGAGIASSAPTTRSCTARDCRRPTREAAVKMAYGRDETDEFIQPTVVGEPAPIRDGDSVVTFNFRPDRMREIVRALGEPDFDGVRAARVPASCASPR